MVPAEEGQELEEPLIPEVRGLEGGKLKCVKYGSLFILLISTVACEVLKKQVQIAAPAFPNAITQLMPLAGIVVFPIVVLCALAIGSNSCEEVKVHWSKPCIIGISFCLHHTLMNLGARGQTVPGALVIALSKLVIPVSMILGTARWSLGYHYGFVHWASAIVLMVGIFMMAAEDFHGRRGGNQMGMLTDMTLIAVSTLPLAFAFLYIERSLKHVERNLSSMALWMWVCCFQLLTGLALTPVTGTLRGMGAEGTWAELSEGCECLLLGRTPERMARGPQAGETQCDRARVSFFAFLIPSFAMNFCMPVVTRYGSAALLWFVRALAVAAGSTLFASTTVMGPNAKRLGPLQGIGVLLVTLGVLLFSLKEPHLPPLPSDDEELEMAERSSRSSSPTVAAASSTAATEEEPEEGAQPNDEKHTQSCDFNQLLEWLRRHGIGAVIGCWGCLLALLPPDLNPNDPEQPWSV
mmetsp:Transcript_49077/g.116809  ORF Transcript_49077/g.116809 Transcript_49077/m.116809 type:complete len:466 (+) Transcript_49077:124-1521(+)